MPKLTLEEKLENIEFYATSHATLLGLSPRTLKSYLKDIKNAIENVTLGSLKNVINTDLTIYDMRHNRFYENVCANSDIFESLRNYKVVSIRDYSSCTHVDKGIVISII